MHLRTPSHYRKAVAELQRLEGVRSRAATIRRYKLLAAVHEFELKKHASPAERKGKPVPFALAEEFQPRRRARRARRPHGRRSGA